MKKGWHELSLEEIERELDTDLSGGLSVREARKRLENEKKSEGGEITSLFVPREKDSFPASLRFFSAPPFLILILTALLSAFFGEHIIGLCVFVIAFLGALLCGSISAAAQKRIDSMSDFASPLVRVIRGGKRLYTDGRTVVRGDISCLSRGDFVTCDTRIIGSEDLTVRELFNTAAGIRNRDVKKNHAVSYAIDDNVAAPNAVNTVYAGSVITGGEALAVAVETGGEVYLSRFIQNGALSRGGGSCRTARILKPFMSRVCFYILASIILLSLIGIISLKEIGLAHGFMIILSSAAFVSFDLLDAISIYNLASCIEKSSGRSKNNKGKDDTSAFIRDIRTADALTEVTDLILVGGAALYEGNFKVGEVFCAGGEYDSLDPDTLLGGRLLTYLHTYLKAIEESKVENRFVKCGICESLSKYLVTSEFDIGGVDLIINSLYFMPDESREGGFACAETTVGEFRVAVTSDSSILSACNGARADGGRDILEIESLFERITSFTDNASSRGGGSLYIVSDRGGEVILEGIISIYRNPALELSKSRSVLSDLGVSVTSFMSYEDERAVRGFSPEFVDMIFDGKVAYASDFAQGNIDIVSNIGEYSAYVGFSNADCLRLMLAMKEKGCVISVYAVEDEYYELCSGADLSVSCDILHYSSKKFKESLYERLAYSGQDSSLRCSQRTRLASGVLVHRSHNGGGGLKAILNAIYSARCANVSIMQAVLLFALITSTILPFVVCSVLSGVVFLNAIHSVSLAAASALLALIAFIGSTPKIELIRSGGYFRGSPINFLYSKLPGIIARASLSFASAVVIIILDVIGVFGFNASYSMPVFISVLIMMFVEIFIINKDVNCKGVGRSRCYIRLIMIYTFLLSVCALISLPPISDYAFPHGTGAYEYFIIPAYLLLYMIAVFVSSKIERGRK